MDAGAAPEMRCNSHLSAFCIGNHTCGGPSHGWYPVIADKPFSSKIVSPLQPPVNTGGDWVLGSESLRFSPQATLVYRFPCHHPSRQPDLSMSLRWCFLRRILARADSKYTQVGAICSSKSSWNSKMYNPLCLLAVYWIIQYVKKLILRIV